MHTFLVEHNISYLYLKHMITKHTQPWESIPLKLSIIIIGCFILNLILNEEIVENHGALLQGREFHQNNGGAL